MSRSFLARAAVLVTTLAMFVFASAANAQAPGVKQRSEAKRDSQSNNYGTGQKAEKDHQKRMESSKKAADAYKSSNKDAKAKQNYQDSKKKGNW